MTDLFVFCFFEVMQDGPYVIKSGVNEEVIQLADDVVEIRQFGTKHSLNISVSIGIVVWDILSKQKIEKD